MDREDGRKEEERAGSREEEEGKKVEGEGRRGEGGKKGSEPCLATSSSSLFVLISCEEGNAERK